MDKKKTLGIHGSLELEVLAVEFSLLTVELSLDTKFITNSRQGSLNNISSLFIVYILINSDMEMTIVHQQCWLATAKRATSGVLRVQTSVVTNSLRCRVITCYHVIMYGIGRGRIWCYLKMGRDQRGQLEVQRER